MPPRDIGILKRMIKEILSPEFKDLFYATSTIEDGSLSFMWGEEKTVLKNRKQFLSKHNIKPKDCVGTHLVHKDNFRIVGNKDKGKCMADPDDCFEADGLITKERGLYLFLLTADCIPLTVYDPKEKILSLVHVSRINSGMGIASKLVKFLKNEFSCNPIDLLIHIGPCVHKESYTKIKPGHIDGDESWGPYIETLDDGRVIIDLVGYNTDRLLESGVEKKNIFQSPSDTCSTEQYFSHLRSKTDRTPEGRFATVVGIRLQTDVKRVLTTEPE